MRGYGNFSFLFLFSLLSFSLPLYLTLGHFFMLEKLDCVCHLLRVLELVGDVIAHASRICSGEQPGRHRMRQGHCQIAWHHDRSQVG